MTEHCTGVTLTSDCGNPVTHKVAINAPTGYREAEHCEQCAQERAAQTYVGDPVELEE